MSVIIRTFGIALLIFVVPVEAYDVLISVTGNLVGNTCEISADAKEQDVYLGDISIKQFTGAGTASNITTPFTLKLESCGPSFAGVKILFSGTPDTEEPQLLKITDGGATGVAVQLLDKDGVPLPLNTHTETYGSTGDNSVQMTFYARLVATGATLNTGNVSAIATWTTEYQ